MANRVDSSVEIIEGPEPGYFEVHVRCPKRPRVVELVIIATERMSCMLNSLNLSMEPSISLSVVAKKGEGTTSEDLAILHDMLVALLEVP
ncbi:hypothetical protein KP509_10G016400 [Ceratopteris richardii]|uniref:Uncharacterized protein n=1 Tax=Ceratopteris richardii TaxID=49495 RepID=A0A8T2TZI8_CERRI|nr:hypothetical protein KP509_10G016400 [Ceratopteris richardii]